MCHPWQKPAETSRLQVASLISAMELAMRNGDDALLRQAAPLLQDVIDRIQREVFELSELQYRACCIRDELAAGRLPPPPAPGPGGPHATA